MGHKLLFISDIHFGIKNNSETYLNVMKDFFTKTLVKIIKDNNITDVRVLGDVFDCRNSLNIRTMNMVLDIFKGFQTTIPNTIFTMFDGNHDEYYRNTSEINALRIFESFSNIKLLNEITEETIDGKSIISVPWLVEDSHAKAKFQSICNGPKKYDLCLGHFEIKGFEISKGYFDDFSKEEPIHFKNFKKVFTGHYHIRDTKGNITYIGCPYPLTWNDYGNTKGIYIYDLTTEEVLFTENKDSPGFYRITVQEIIDNKELSLDKIKGNNIKLVIDKKYDEVELLKSMAKIESVKPIKLDIEHEFIEEIDTNENIDVSKMNNPLSFLKEYVDSIEIEDLDKDELLKHIADIYQTVNKE